MKKPVFGLLLGGFLGIFDGLSALVSAPETAPQIGGIVIGSTIKGLLAGALIGWYARRKDSLAAGVIFGGVVGLLLAFLVSLMQKMGGQPAYYWQIMLPGAILGVIVGYATQRHRERGSVVLLALLVAGATSVEAQLARPATWKVVVDQSAGDSALEYSTMPPGWHVTTGPGALFFDPAWQVAPAGVVHAEIFLFPDSGPAEYGVFLAGDAMSDELRRYTAVLLRRDGRAGVFRHEGGKVDTLLAWTANPAIAALDGKTGGAVKNVLRIETSAAGISISVNGTAVATIPGSSAGPGTGQAGLRVGEKMNMHISKFEVQDSGIKIQD